MLAGLLALVLLVKGKADFLTSWWTWFLASCMLHTLVDIPVHHDDGPLVFWPVNWSYRFASPISYWDRAHYAAIVIPLELTLATVLAGKLIYGWIQSRF